ncbi:MAG: DUF2867 domain-containing protein [Hyphomicrobiales bacterium]|nr:DUF2867 domain-containing protein [Hyphomicrobiales bacterium]
MVFTVLLQKAQFPLESQLASALHDADFHDAYVTSLHDRRLTPSAIFLKALRATPAWVLGAMDMRNAIVRHLGLKDVGAMRADRRAAEDYRVGDRMGIFNIFAADDNELLLGIDDSHLDVRVSVLKPRGDASRYIVSTVVHIHNALGRAYMLPVARIHPLVVRAMMRAAQA